MIYTVIWRYDVSADNPKDAIIIANRAVIEQHPVGWVYEVEDEDGNLIMCGRAEVCEDKE